MAALKRLTPPALAGVAICCAIPVLALGASARKPRIYASPDLWATVDVCKAPDQPHTLGVRGSMPGDGHAHDVMYMRFRVQYVDPISKKWDYLAKEGDSGFLLVGSASGVRQAGRSFQLVPVAGQASFKLRGMVSFQWRRGRKVIYETSRNTSPGRHSLAGSDPHGFSAATCTSA